MEGTFEEWPHRRLPAHVGRVAGLCGRAGAVCGRERVWAGVDESVYSF